MLLPVSDCLIRRLIACARYELSKEDALSHRDKMRYAKRLLNNWVDVNEFFKTKLDLELESYNIFSEISESQYLELIEKSRMGYFPLIARNKEDDFVDTLLMFEKLCIRCYLQFCTNKEEAIEILLKEMEYGISKLDEENCKDSQSFTDLYYHYFTILSDILLIYDYITISNISFWNKLLDNDFIYSKWEDSVKEKYEIKQHANRIKKFIEWRECFFKQKVFDCNNSMQEDTITNLTCDIDYHYWYFDNKLKRYSDLDEQDTFIHIHLLRSICIIVGYKLRNISERGVNMAELFSSIFETNAWNKDYLKKLKDTLLQQSHEAEDAEIKTILRIKVPQKTTTNNQVYIFEKHEQEYILGKIRDLFDKDILDERYKVAITDILEKFLNTGNLVVNNKIEMPKNKAELLYGFFFSFCKEKQKSKANAFTTFIRGVFEPVASEKTLNHNWNKYKRQYNEQ